MSASGITPAQSNSPQRSDPVAFKRFEKRTDEEHGDGEMAEGQPVGAVGEEGETGVGLLKRKPHKGDPVMKSGEIRIVGRVGDAQPRGE
jgi:hypothetical protein